MLRRIPKWEGLGFHLSRERSVADFPALHSFLTDRLSKVASILAVDTFTVVNVSVSLKVQCISQNVV